MIFNLVVAMVMFLPLAFPDIFMGGNDDMDSNASLGNQDNSGMTGEDFLAMGDDDEEALDSLDDDDLEEEDALDDDEDALDEGTDDLGMDDDEVLDENPESEADTANADDEGEFVVPPRQDGDVDIDFDDLEQDDDEDVEDVIERLSVLGDPFSNTVLGTSDDEFITGEGGDDILSGGAGSDRLEGGSGDDFVAGTQSRADGATDDATKDLLFGGDGSDVLFLGDYDEATGGTGTDLFSIDTNAENQVIVNDFDLGRDIIDIEVSQDEDLSVDTNVVVDGDTIVTLTNGLEIVIKGVVDVPNTALNFVIEI